VTTPTKKKSKAPVPAKYNPVIGLFEDKDGNPIHKQAADKPPSVTRDEFKLDTRSVFDKDQAMLLPENRTVTKDADGYHVGNAGKKSLGIPPRKLYRKGLKFRVIGENVRMEAMCSYGNGANGQAIWSGWSRRLEIGTIVECIGWRRFRKDGLVAPQFVYDELPAEAKWSSVWPHDGVMRPWPLAGILELVVEEDS
jgi:hypothetical protein